MMAEDKSDQGFPEFSKHQEADALKTPAYMQTHTIPNLGHCVRDLSPSSCKWLILCGSYFGSKNFSSLIRVHHFFRSQKKRALPKKSIANLDQRGQCFHQLFWSLTEKDRNYKRIIRTAIVTARNAPAHERVITTLEHWGVSANETFFLGGMKKDRILNRLRPHMFFDDQRSHLESEAGDIPMVHIPFGIANKTIEQVTPEGLCANNLAPCP